MSLETLRSVLYPSRGESVVNVSMTEEALIYNDLRKNWSFSNDKAT